MDYLSIDGDDSCVRLIHSGTSLECMHFKFHTAHARVCAHWENSPVLLLITSESLRIFFSSSSPSSFVIYRSFIAWTHSNCSLFFCCASLPFPLGENVHRTWILPMTINKQTIIRVIQRNQVCHAAAFRMMKAFATFHDLHYYSVKQI